MNPIVIGMLVFVVVAIAAVSTTFLQQQNNSIDTGVKVSERQNDRIRETIEFSASDGIITIQNEGSKKSRILEIRILNEDGTIIKTWTTNQQLNVAQSNDLLLDNSIQNFLRSYNAT